MWKARYLVLIGTLFGVMDAWAGSVVDSACSAIVEATAKLLRTPHRSIATFRFDDANESVIVQEALFLDGKTYLRESGEPWSEGSSTESMMDAYRERLKSAKNLRCRYLRDERIEGKLAALYRTQETVGQQADVTYLWILKSEGQIVGSETEITETNGRIIKLSISNEFRDLQ